MFRDEAGAEIALFVMAAELVPYCDGCDASFTVETATELVTTVQDQASVLTIVRATGPKTGRSLFVALARRRLLTVEEDAWDGLPENARAFLECLARLASAFAGPAHAEAAAGERTLVIQAVRPKVEDTIFQRTGGKDKGFERLGEAGGRRTSGTTGDVMIQPAAFAPDGATSGTAVAEIGVRMRAMGLRPPMPDGEDERDFAAEVAGRLEAELGPAPAPPPFVARQVVAGQAGGERIEGQVFVSSPFGAAAGDAASQAAGGAPRPPAAEASPPSSGPSGHLLPQAGEGKARKGK